VKSTIPSEEAIQPTKKFIALPPGQVPREINAAFRISCIERIFVMEVPYGLHVSTTWWLQQRCKRC